MKGSDPTGLIAVLAGVLGGAVTLLQQARAKRRLLKWIEIVSALVTAGFVAWIMDLLAFREMNENIRVGMCGVVGVAAERTLDLLVSKWLSIASLKQVNGGPQE